MPSLASPLTMHGGHANCMVRHKHHLRDCRKRPGADARRGGQPDGAAPAIDGTDRIFEFRGFARYLTLLQDCSEWYSSSHDGLVNLRSR